MRHVVLIIATALCVHAQAEPPAIFQNGVFNSASRFPRTLPGGVIAHGARFTIQGVRLGANGRTKVEVRTGERVHLAQLLNVSGSAIEAILPATVPPGDATVVVIVDGKPSAPAAIRVGMSAPGLYTVNQLGWGAVSQPRTAAPGDTVVLAATGQRGTVADVFVGERSVKAAVRSKAGSAGIEELTFVLPRDVPEGCHVPVYTKTGDLVSNIVSLRVARRASDKSSTCRESIWPSTQGDNATVVLYQIILTLEINAGDPQSNIEEHATAVFSAAGSPVPPIRVLPPSGTCSGAAGTYQSGQASRMLYGLNLDLPGGRMLDAGRQLEVSGHASTRKLTARSPGFFSQSLAPRADRSAHPPPFLFPGDYTISGSGGTAVGAFQAQLHVGTPLVWIGREKFSQVDRKKGAELKWAGEDPRQPVIVSALSIDRSSSAYFLNLCVVPPGAKQFTIPPAILANLPATEDGPGVPLSYISVLQSPTGSMTGIHGSGVTGVAIYFGGGGRSVFFY